MDKKLPKVLLLENIEKRAVSIFEENGYLVEHLPHALGEEELLGKIQEVEVLGIRSKTKITKTILRNAPNLKVVAAYCIGTNQIDLESCKELGVKVFNDPFSNGRSVVELALGELIMLSRGIVEKNKKMKEGVWEKTASNSFEVRNKKLGIVGYGNIGSQLGILAEALGMEVYYFDILEKEPLGRAKTCKSMEELLKICDIVSVHVDGSKRNTNLIGEKEFTIMKDGVILLNLSRGHVVDLEALDKNLQSGKVLGAGIDVYPEEPERNGEGFYHSLAKHPNVILTPHIGGSTKEAQEKIARVVTEKILNSFEEFERSAREKFL